MSRRSHGSVLALNSRVVHDHIDIRCWQGILLWQEIGCKSKGYKLYEPELATRAYTHIFCLLARKRFRRRDNLGCPSQSRDSTDAFYASTHGSHSVRTSIVRMYNISISTYCCFAVALSVPRAASLAGHVFAATKRLQKQGLKTIGTKPCYASMHTYLLARRRFRRRNNLGCPSQSCESTDAFHASTHGSHSVRTNIVYIYNISVSTYCCFAVALSVPRAALAGHIFSATKRLQKQGLKTIGTKPCNASIHTYIQPAHMDLILLAQTC